MPAIGKFGGARRFGCVGLNMFAVWVTLRFSCSVGFRLASVFEYLGCHRPLSIAKDLMPQYVWGVGDSALFLLSGVSVGLGV